jgi:hypothetical protein
LAWFFNEKYTLARGPRKGWGNSVDFHTLLALVLVIIVSSIYFLFLFYSFCEHKIYIVSF